MQCSKDCQKMHWKSHKADCADIQRSRQHSIEINRKRLVKLLREWGAKGIDFLYETFGLATFQRIQSERLLVLITVDFDYNAFTFVPVELPKMLSTDDGEVSSGIAADVHASYDEFRTKRFFPQFEEGITLRTLFYVLYKKENFGLLKTVDANILGGHEDTPMSLHEIVTSIQSNAQLTSSKRGKWEPIKQANIKLQVDSICKSEHMKRIIIQSFRLSNNEDRQSYLSHNVMVIFIEEGYNLGEIKSLARYSMVKTETAKKLCQSKVSETEDPNVVFAPFESNNKNEKNTATVVFLGRTMFYIISIDLEEEEFLNVELKSLNMNEGSTKTMKERADAAFAKLRTIRLPKVESPPLH